MFKLKPINSLVVVFSVFVFSLLITSCRQKIAGYVYVIIGIEENIAKTRIEECFKADLIFFKDDNIVTMPGFEIPFDKGKFERINNSQVRIYNLKDCYFNGVYDLEFTTKRNIDFLILKNKSFRIVCRKVDFVNSRIDQSIVGRFLDTTSWNSPHCQQIREKLCKKVDSK